MEKEKMTVWHKLGVAGIALLIAAIFRYGIVKMFAISEEANSVLLMNLLIILAPILVLVYYFTSGRVQAVLITVITTVIIMVGFSAWAERENPEAADSIDRANSGTVLAFLKSITPAFVKNDTVNHHYNKACDDAISKNRSKAEQQNLDRYTNGEESEAEFIKQRQLDNMKYQQVGQCNMEMMTVFPTMPGGDPNSPENQIKPAKRKPLTRHKSR